MNKLIESFKKSKSSLILVILALVLIILGISFAIVSPSINLLGRREIKISKCELDINFKESDELMLVNKYPISKEEALKYEAKDITITNNSTCDTTYYRLTIKDLNGSSINKDIINYQLIDKSTNTISYGTNTNDFKVSGSLTKGNSISYSIRLWIDESATNNDLYENGDVSKPYEYKFALNIETSDEKIVDLVPILNIPVGTNGLEKVTHTIDNALQVDENFATEYRYRGGNSTVKNYVTFNNETWRIIGILPTEDTDGNVEYRFKIIRDTSIGSYYWNSTQDSTTSSYNNWVTGTLNTYLNGDYYNSLSTDAQSMIGTAKYYLGGYSTSDITSDVIWQYERKVVQNDASKKIALMYASDYGYAASTTCTRTLVNYDTDACKTTNNWLDKSQDEWILPQVSSTTFGAFMVVGSSGNVDGYGTYCVDEWFVAVRPVLSLSSSVMISGGSGTSSDPYTLSL